jgi:hypothetical protein
MNWYNPWFERKTKGWFEDTETTYIMKNLLICGVIFFLLSGIGISQSILHLRDATYYKLIPKNGMPKLIEEVNIFYREFENEEHKSILLFSQNLDTVYEKRFVNGVYNADLLYVFNSNKNLIYRSLKNKIPGIGWQCLTTVYNYDETGLIGTQTHDCQNNIIDIMKIENDSLKQPVRLALYNANNKLQGYETAEYDYIKNICINKIFNSFGKLINEKNYPIKAKINGSDIYNDQGDCTLSKSSGGGNYYQQIEYAYDHLGNWISQQIYVVEKIGNAYKHKKRDRKCSRKIVYQK